MRKMLPFIIIVVVLAIAGGLYIGLNHKNNTNTNTNSQTAHMNMPNQSATGTSGQAQSTNKVTIANFAFSPASITVKKGTTVTWTNNDAVAHTVTETDGQTGPQSQDVSKGQSYSFTYNTMGTFKYHCSIHPEMVGTVTVTE